MRQQGAAFYVPLFLRDFHRRGMDHAVSCSGQPGFSFLLQVLKGTVLTVEQEVALDVFHCILDLAFAFRIRRTAKDRFERTALHIAPEDCCHPVVTDVLVIKEDRILVIYYIWPGTP